MDVNVKPNLRLLVSLLASVFRVFAEVRQAARKVAKANAAAAEANAGKARIRALEAAVSQARADQEYLEVQFSNAYDEADHAQRDVDCIVTLLRA
jgi:hypothetical protein